MVTPHIQTHMLVALTKTVHLFLMDVWAPLSLSTTNASEQRGISEALVIKVELGLSRAILNHRGAIASLTVRVDADGSHCPESPATNPSTQQADPLDLVFIKHGGSLLSNYRIYLASGVIDRCKVPLHRLAEAHLEACAHANASAVLQAHRRAQVAAVHANSMGCCHRHRPRHLRGAREVLQQGTLLSTQLEAASSSRALPTARASSSSSGCSKAQRSAV